MATETEWQRKIVAQVKAEGGHGYKNDSQLNTAYGRPDLTLMTPELGMFMAEVKLELTWFIDTGRTLKITNRQREEHKKILAAGGPTCIIVVAEVATRQYVLYASRTDYVFGVPVSRKVLIQNGWRWKDRNVPFMQYLYLRLVAEKLRYG